MNAVTSWIGKIGENAKFITAQAHIWFACAFVLAWPNHMMRLYGAAAVAVVAALKEFWFDLRFEQSPPQTLADSALDYLEYCIGIAIAVCLVFLV